MDTWNFDYTTRSPARFYDSNWTLTEPKDSRFRMWEKRIARDGLGLTEVGSATLIILILLGVLSGRGLAGILIGLIPFPVILFGAFMVRRRVARSLGSNWRRSRIIGQDFFGLPESYNRLAHEIYRAMYGIQSSRAAAVGWIGRHAIHDAHVATWHTMLRLLETRPLHGPLQEAKQFDELAPLVAARKSELATIEATVKDVADQLDDAYRKIIQLDKIIIAQEAERARGQKLSELELELGGGESVTMVNQSVPLLRQDVLDAIHANIDGALTVLAIGNQNPQRGLA
jgi:hypothetical protein